MQEAPAQSAHQDDEDTVAGRPVPWTPKPAPARLPAGTLRAARDFAEAFFATEAGPPPADRLTWMTRDLDDFLGRAGARGRTTFRLALFAVTWCAPLVIGRLGPLGRLSIEDRVHGLERMESTPGIGLALFLVLSLIHI